MCLHTALLKAEVSSNTGREAQEMSVELLKSIRSDQMYLLAAAPRIYKNGPFRDESRITRNKSSRHSCMVLALPLAWSSAFAFNFV